VRVLVTGGAGFIGSHVAAALAGVGHEVRLFDGLHPAAHGPGTARRSYLDGVPLAVGDLRDAPAVRAALSGMDAVAHHAAMVGMGRDVADLPEYVGCNDLGTAVLLAGMAELGIGRLVLASSMVVYGEGAYRCPRDGRTRPPPRDRVDLAAGRFEPSCPACGAELTPETVDEDAPLAPRSGYAATKVAQEHLAGAWSAATGGHVIALRYHNVYGPRMPRDTPYSGVAAIFRSALAGGRPPQVFEDGGPRRDFVHVSDVAAANVRALAAIGEGGRGGWLRPYNIASGSATTVLAMAAALAAAMGGPAPVVTGEFRAGDVRHVVASPGRARDELGFMARIGPEAGFLEFATAPLRGDPEAAAARAGRPAPRSRRPAS
jgi:dTDP-L-rhamnose 4-epimerase